MSGGGRENESSITTRVEEPLPTKNGKHRDMEDEALSLPQHPVVAIPRPNGHGLMHAEVK
jgi:hypothetical protein